MNLFSGIKKIFLLGFFVLFFYGSSISSAVEKLDQVIKLDRNQTVGSEIRDMFNPNLTFSGENGDSRKTGQTTKPSFNWSTDGGNGATFKKMYAEAFNAPSDTFGIDGSEIFAVAGKEGTLYVQDLGEKYGDSRWRIIAEVTEKGAYIPNSNLSTNSTEAKGFFESIDKNNGFEVGTLSTEATKYNVERNRDGNEKAFQQAKEAFDKSQQAKAAAEAAAAAYEKAKGDPNVSLSDKEVLKRQAEAAKSNQVAAEKTADAAVDKSKTSITGVRKDNATISCGIRNFFTGPCILQGLSYIANLALKLASYVLGVAGSLLDYSIELSVNSAQFIQSLNVVDPMWAFVRDVLNMSFIFILLWIALNMVLGRSGIGGAKSYTIKTDVRNVVLVAILINFSLFFAKLLIDGSNLATLEIYQLMKPAPSAATADKSIGISDQIMNTLQLQGLSDIGEVSGSKSCEGIPSVTLVVGVFGTIFVLVLAVAFGLAALLFIIRLPNIIYLLISSPLWIWGYVMKGGIFEKTKNSWTKNMYHMCTFPIIYMLWMFVGVFTFHQLLGAKDGSSMLDLLCKSTDQSTFAKSLSVFLVFAIVITVMIKAIKYAMDSGAGSSFMAPLAQKVADRAGSLQKKITQGTYDKAKGLTVGTAKFVGKPLVWAKDGAKSLVRRPITALNNDAATALAHKAAGAKSNIGRKFYAGLAGKLQDPKIFGQTQKEVNKGREEQEGKKQADIFKTMDTAGVFKIKSRDAYKKANPKNKETADDDYDAEVKKKTDLILNALLGSSILQQKHKDPTKGSNRDAIMSEVFELDPTTKRKELNQANLYKAITATHLHHTKGTASKNGLSMTASQKRLLDYGQSKAKGMVDKMRLQQIQLEGSTVKKEDQSDRLKSKQKDLEKLEKRVVAFKSVDDIDKLVDSEDYYNDSKKYGIDVEKYAEKREAWLRLPDSQGPEKVRKETMGQQIAVEKEKLETKISKERDKLYKLKSEIETLEAEVNK